MFKLKKLIGNLIGIILLLIFKRSSIRKYNNQVLSIYFHNPSVLLFKGIIRFLQAHHFSFISEQEYLNIMEDDVQVSERLVFISFDDGWRGNLKLIPIIEDNNIPVTIFIPVEPVVAGNFWWEYSPAVIAIHQEFSSLEDLKKLKNADRIKLIDSVSNEVQLNRTCIDLKELKAVHDHKLITIGSHSYHHPITIKCTNEELDFEYRESKNTLEKWLETEIHSFSYPNGDFDDRDINRLKEFGYKMAFTTNSEMNKEREVYRISRISINSHGGIYENIARMLGIWHRMVEPLQIKSVKISKLVMNLSKG
jgi:peptidoglycan/xylan/chitin deacetylase (PgdA/CDA1 family)